MVPPPRNAGTHVSHSRSLKLSFTQIAFSCGLSSTLFLTFLVAFTALGFAIGISPSIPTTVVSAIFACIVTILLPRCHWLSALAGLLVSAALVFAACAVCSSFYDFSYDGNAIHKLAVSALRGGWIPIEGSSSIWQEANEVFGEHCSIWIDHYPQGTWEIAANLYACTGSIETGKAYTLIAAFGAAMLLVAYLRTRRISVGKCIILALVATVNPITVAQFLTFYNDAFLMLELLVLLLGLTMLVDVQQTRLRPVAFTLIACAFLLCTETKFTGLAYAGVFSLSFYIYLLAKTLRRREGFTASFLLGVSAFFAILISSSVLVFGFSSYVMNFLEHGHPLYPLFGENAEDIMTSNSPASFADSSNPRKLLLSFFSQSGNILAASGAEPVLKLPFSFTPEELGSLHACDLRIGGFGVLYSGILILQLAIIAILLPKQRKTRPFLFQTALCYLIPTIALMAFLGESWWARYCAYFYFTSCLALLLLLLPGGTDSSASQIVQKALSVLFILLLAANTAFFALYNTKVIVEKTASENKHIAKLEKAARSGKRIVLGYKTEPGAVYALTDRDIPFEFIGPVPEDFKKDGKFNRLYYKLEEDAHDE